VCLGVGSRPFLEHAGRVLSISKAANGVRHMIRNDYTKVICSSALRASI
jgi:hypothetical protein